MFSSSQFDAVSAFSGGGFMPSQSSHFANSTPSQSHDTQGLLSVTVKKISEASRSGDEKPNFIIDGAHVNNVKVIGMLFNKNVRSSDVRFDLDDGTGRVECIRWVTESVDTREMDALEEGTYVCVIGHLQSFQGKVQLNAFSVRPVTNFDEVTCHFIECIYCHVQNSKGQLEGGALAQPKMTDSSLSTPVRGASNVHQPASMCRRSFCPSFIRAEDYIYDSNRGPNQSKPIWSEPKTRLTHKCRLKGGDITKIFNSLSSRCQTSPITVQPFGDTCNKASVQYTTDGFKGFEKLVLNYLQQPAIIDREMGVHLNELSQQLKAPIEKIKDAIEFLEREGLVYSSIDDYHYKAVEGC
ncbi:replication protein A 32 kDa subunit A-like [Hibiscus syriacus]|uniref:replication protein A 32 kDa subunit A-like n=1 Tax=Hibiscus syriacus TaxID=106335 RepID=UPI0019246E46|nr:replication protein A 32 kDa subunit A-like [Hibiscus syriacus]